MMADKPLSATLFTFNVGFGDCFLLRFQYANDVQKHVLIDFGSVALPDNKPGKYMVKIARKIKELCGGVLDVVVATHRHRDHISGFSTSKSGKGPGDIIKECMPKLVLQPWTEHPRAATDAKISPDQGRASMAFAGALNNMNRFAKSVRRIAEDDMRIARVDETKGFYSERVRTELSFLGQNNIANKKAVVNLMNMGDERRYLAFGQDPGVKDILPGVSLDVLGPPTLEQGPQIAKQNAKNKEEYWHLKAASVEASLDTVARQNPAFPNSSETVPQWARWGKIRLNKMRSNMLMPIVRDLDRAMNNTSLILLFSVGEQSMLFPGDAQWENWSYALSKPDVREKLKSVDLYKVGHHGSLNATPKSMWDLFENKGAKGKDGRLKSILSTKHGVHGHSKDTEVPRDILVDKLNEESDFETTETNKITKKSKEFYTTTQLEFR